MVRKKSALPDWNAAKDLEFPVERSQCVDLEEMGHLSIVGGFAHGIPAVEADLDHTPDHKNCPACKAVNLALQAEKVKLSTLPFSHARKFWTLLRRQSTSLKERTHETDAQYLDQLEKFFGKICLRDIAPGHLRAYQIARQSNRLRIRGQDTQPWTKPCGHSIINHELSVLQRILEHCHLWARLKPYYFPLKTPKWSLRQILSDEEEEQFFHAAAANPDCGVAYWVAAITTNTSASGIELRGLRMKHIFLREPNEISEIYVPEDAVKNDCRPRKLPLNPLAHWAVAQCYKRALQLGCCEPDHYVFPFHYTRENGPLKANGQPAQFDPTRPPSRWVFRWSWNKLRRITGFPNVKPHDFRFLCITKLLEAGEDPETVRAVAGHVSQRMVEYYAKHRRKAKYAAVMKISGKKEKPATPKKKPPVSEQSDSVGRRKHA